MWVPPSLRSTEVFVTHANAPLTPEGRRRLAALVVEQGWTVRRAAERFQVSPATASEWARRYRYGEAMVGASWRGDVPRGGVVLDLVRRGVHDEEGHRAMVSETGLGNSQ